MSANLELSSRISRGTWYIQLTCHKARSVSRAELTVVQRFLQIDRLSLLPPELLGVIFDLAHNPEHPLANGLSRTLYPYIRLNLFCQIHLQNPASVQKLIATLQENPHLVPFVAKLTTTRAGTDAYPFENPLETPLFQEFLLLNVPFLVFLLYNTKVLSSRNFTCLLQLGSLAGLKIQFFAFEEDHVTLPGPILVHLKDLHLASLDCMPDQWSPPPYRGNRQPEVPQRHTTWSICCRGLPSLA